MEVGALLGPDGCEEGTLEGEVEGETLISVGSAEGT